MKSHTVIRFPTAARLGGTNVFQTEKRAGPMASRVGWFKRLLRRLK